MRSLLSTRPLHRRLVRIVPYLLGACSIPADQGVTPIANDGLPPRDIANTTTTTHAAAADDHDHDNAASDQRAARDDCAHDPTPADDRTAGTTQSRWTFTTSTGPTATQ